MHTSANPDEYRWKLLTGINSSVLLMEFLTKYWKIENFQNLLTNWQAIISINNYYFKKFNLIWDVKLQKRQDERDQQFRDKEAFRKKKLKIVKKKMKRKGMKTMHSYFQQLWISSLLFPPPPLRDSSYDHGEGISDTDA